MDAIKQAAEASYQGKQQDTSPPDGNSPLSILLLCVQQRAHEASVGGLS